jgi:hypothetical protein
MNREAVGAIGQVLGSLAVFVTLAYLAIQTKHAKEEARRSFFRSALGRDPRGRELSGDQRAAQRDLCQGA